jgi:hypothetical protein
MCTVALVVSPSLRRQLDLSLTRRPEPYVDLYFADVAAARSCRAADGTTSVLVSVASHLAVPRRLRYVARLVPAGRPRHASTHRRTGLIATTPGQVSTFTTTLPVPRSAYGVRIALAGLPQQLLVHCAAPIGSHR